MNINIKNLRAFVAVARAGSFTRAAHSLSLSQPALTVVVHQLEGAVGFSLFDRTTRRVSLTGDGLAFLPVAERLVHDFDTAISDIRAVAQRERGRVEVAALTSVATVALPEVVRQFTAAYPGISVHLREDNSSGVQRRVRSNQVDFGLGGMWERDPELEFAPLARDTFGLVCRADHPLARGDSALPWDPLKGFPFLGLAADTGIRPVLERNPSALEVIASPKYELSNVTTVGAMVMAGLGITVLPSLAVAGIYREGMVFRRLKTPTLKRTLYLITRKRRSLSPAASSLRDIVVGHLPEVVRACEEGTPGSLAQALRVAAPQLHLEDRQRSASPIRANNARRNRHEHRS